MSIKMTGKQRMLNAYRGRFSDRVAIAPEFWYYYPAKLLGVDMIEFERKVPFHQALKKTFETYSCEGWGAAFPIIPNDKIKTVTREKWLDSDTLEVRHITSTYAGSLESASVFSKAEPSWSIERPVKNLENDLAAWEICAFGGNPEDMDVSKMIKAWDEVGETYLLEAWMGNPFFDFFAGSREGGFETAIFDFLNPDFEAKLKELQQRYIERMILVSRIICEKTPFESLCIGCSWSCNSLIGPDLWRKWDKPLIKAVADEIHRHGKLLHIHFHGKCMDTVADFAEIGIDCVCPFERPPGGDVKNADDLKTVAKLLNGKTSMNGNVHTVETLIKGTPENVRCEVREIMEAFKGNPRMILGTGDQVGRETPEENIIAMIEEGKRIAVNGRNS
jgi:hypothetical protein